MNSYHSGRFEWFVVATVIALISVVALGRYWFMAQDARSLRLEVLGHRLVTGAANLRAEFLLSGRASKQIAEQRYLLVNNQPLYFSAQGWPVTQRVAVAPNHVLTEQDCVQLWQLLQQNAAPFHSAAQPNHSAEYQVVSGANLCRYSLRGGAAFFDYYPQEGRLLFAKPSSSHQPE